jgi:protein TonB
VNRAATSSSVDPRAQASWESDVLARLDAAKRYPAAARFAHQEATIQVQFEVDRGGRVIACRLLRPSGVSDLDDEVLSLLKRVRLPPPPLSLAEDDLKLTVPIEFSINHD